MSGIITKIKILIKATNVFKNWYLYPLVYFSIIKRDYIIFETYSGLKIKLRTRSTDLMALTNVWLVEEYSGSNFRINANDVIIDIGAHVGLFTLYASQYCKNGTIFCFEPVDENYDILVDNITQNNLKNVKPFKSAVSKSESTITIYRNKDEAGHSMFSFTSHALKVDSISLKKIIDENSVNQCNLIKIDCEGGEEDIFIGMKNVLANNEHIKILLEISLINGKIPGKLKSIIEKNRLEMTVFGDRGDVLDVILMRRKINS